MTTNTTDPGAVPTDGVRIPVPGGGHLWADRNGTGSPVVLLHGAGMDSRLWDPVVPRLAGRHEVIRFDARGLGRSTEPGAPFSDVEDLRSVLDHFGHRRAALVGLSMGGETSIDFALAHPDRVTALALVGASVGGHSWPTTPELSAYAVARRNGTRHVWPSWSCRSGPPRPHGPRGELIEAMVAHNAARHQQRTTPRPLRGERRRSTPRHDHGADAGRPRRPRSPGDRGDRRAPRRRPPGRPRPADPGRRPLPAPAHPERLTELLLAHLARS
ncbi:alpha/beta fold hydrolase [Kitasatospora aburaviensis]